MPHDPSRERDSAGFTLLELLVVIGVLSVLMGLGLGYLGRTDPTLVAGSILAGEKRSAQLTARAEGVPTEVWIRPGGDGEPATVQSRLLEPVVTFHFEPDTPVLDERLRAETFGTDVPSGRFGHARAPMPRERNPLLRWPVSRAIADLRDGFVLRLDLWLGSRAGCVVVDMQPLLQLRLDEELKPRARLQLRGGADSNVMAAVGGELALPLRRWATLEFGCDGETAWLAIDGREVGRVAAAGTPQQEPDMVFTLSPPDAPVPGMVDELRWFVFSFSPAQMLPIELQPRRSYRLVYDARGEPVAHPEVQWQDPERP